jgi:hypothetical protein
VGTSLGTALGTGLAGGEDGTTLADGLADGLATVDVGDGALVLVLPRLPALPMFARGGKSSTGWPWSAPSV